MHHPPKYDSDPGFARGPLPAEFVQRLRDVLPEHALRTDPADGLVYGSDNSRLLAPAQAVVLADDARQVREVVRACREFRVPLVPRGRGTNTTGAVVPVAGGVVLSLERMDRILRIDPDDRIAVVEPGVLNGDLQRACAAHGLFWPPDPTSADYCTVGGNLACNAGGPRAVKYGAARDNTLALRAIAGTGDELRTGAATTKGAVGYDFTRFLVGSEGTLAVIVEATLRLVPRPGAVATLRALYPDVTIAARAVARLMAQPIVPCALEFTDERCLALIRQHGVALPDAGALLMIEVDGPAAAIEVLAARVAEVARDGAIEVLLAREEAQVAALWAARKALSPALRRVAPGKINEDVVVPVSRLPALVEFTRELSQRHDLPILCFGHAGNGNVHVNILYDPADATQPARAEAALEALFDRVIELEGTLSGEHGIGLAKRPFLSRAVPPATLAMMRAVKAQFDPAGILNPCKLLPAT